MKRALHPAHRLRKDQPDAAPFIFEAQDVLVLVSRAWQLVRATFKTGLVAVLIPTVLVALFNLVIALPLERSFLTPASAGQQTLNLLALGLGIPLALAGYSVWGFAGCVLSRFYWSVITRPQPDSLSDCATAIRRRLPTLSALLSVILLLLILFIAGDFLLFFVGITRSASFAGMLLQSGQQAGGGLPSVITILFLLLWGAAVLGLLIALITLEAFLLCFPLLSFATDDENPEKASSWRHHLLVGWQMAFAQWHALLPFALTLFVFTLATSLALSAPLLLWAKEAAFNPATGSTVPLGVATVLNCWRSLIDLLLAPFTISALTFFWYDCRVRTEGLDLRLRLDALSRQRPPSPQSI